MEPENDVLGMPCLNQRRWHEGTQRATSRVANIRADNKSADSWRRKVAARWFLQKFTRMGRTRRAATAWGLYRNSRCRLGCRVLRPLFVLIMIFLWYAESSRGEVCPVWWETDEGLPPSDLCVPVVDTMPSASPWLMNIIWQIMFSYLECPSVHNAEHATEAGTLTSPHQSLNVCVRVCVCGRMHLSSSSHTTRQVLNYLNKRRTTVHFPTGSSRLALLLIYTDPSL